MPRRTLAALLLATLLPCCDGCPPPPPSEPSDCWGHVGAASGKACATADDIEPNDTLSDANHVANEATCTDNVVQGKIGADVDVFRTTAARCDDSRPTATLASDDASVRLCMFVACKYGKTGTMNCTQDAMHLPEGLHGCCVTGPGEIALDVNCDSDSVFASGVLAQKQRVTTFFVVDRPSGTGCANYEITYHY